MLVVSNMRAAADHPERGRFVRDQVDALRTLPDLEVELYEFPPGGAALAHAARELSRRYGFKAARLRLGHWRHPTRRSRRPDVVHAHFGLTAWPALAARARVRGLTVHGTDMRHPRTRIATRAVLPLMDLVAAPTPELADALPSRSARRKAQVLPCGVDLERFHPIPRAEARAELGLDPRTPCLLFPADPARLGKRYDRALALAGATPLHTLGGVPPERVPLWVNAANAVVVPSDSEGFGLAVLEALACDVPVLATPVGVHPQALAEVEGTLCEPFALRRWRAAAAAHLADSDPRIAGRARAERWSAVRMAERLADVWRERLARTRADRGHVHTRVGETDE
ncbi:MAG TPA: glycosyltransferase [Solirubrobacteraceae bacterium]|nr:glycosyltransferase [Solirubrobacteraceae bacterium]